MKGWEREESQPQKYVSQTSVLFDIDLHTAHFSFQIETQHHSLASTPLVKVKKEKIITDPLPEDHESSNGSGKSYSPLVAKGAATPLLALEASFDPCLPIAQAASVLGQRSRCKRPHFYLVLVL